MNINIIKNVIFAFGLLAFFSMIGIVGRIESTYTMHGRIVDHYTIEDDRGHLWGYESDIEAGSEVMITFDNNHTDTIIYDDSVISVK